MPALIDIQLIAIRRVVSPLASTNTSKDARMTIQLDNGTGPLIRIPFAPRNISYDERGSDWTSVTRPGIEPLLLRRGPKLNQISFDLVVADKEVLTTGNGQRYVLTAETILAQLDKYAKDGSRLRVVFGAFASGLWYLTDFKFDSRRLGSNDEIVEASANLTFQRANDVVDSVGPITGGVKPPQPTPSPPAPPQQTGARYYNVVKGDTLWGISIKFYGTGTRWTTIANANGVKDPKKLQIGTRLRIP